MRQRSSKLLLRYCLPAAGLFLASAVLAAPGPALTGTALAQALGWTFSASELCGGYYLDAPFPAGASRADNHVSITGDQGVFSLHGTSSGLGRVTIMRQGQVITANSVRLYRDPRNGRLVLAELGEHVTLREPGNIVLADQGKYDIRSGKIALHDVFYRSTLTTAVSASLPAPADLRHAQRVKSPGFFGRARAFFKTAPGVFLLEDATYSFCPPVDEVWHLRAARVTLNKNTGRGTATKARLYLHEVPVFYTPWINFPLDARRQTGFLSPSLGVSGKNGPWVRFPFYWNMAPDHDMTLTPGFLSKRGLQLASLFRWLSPQGSGRVSLAVLPRDRAFGDFQKASDLKYANSTDPAIQAERRRLDHASMTRFSVEAKENRRFGPHWSSHVDYSRVSDDYYLRDLDTRLNSVTDNQLLQEALLSREGEIWHFSAAMQGYQALHPIDQTPVENQYARLPQLVLNGRQSRGPLTWFVSSELTRFALSPTPGAQVSRPVGDRLNLQPGVSLSLKNAWFYVRPRMQFAMTQYWLAHNTADTPANPGRALPIFDTEAGIWLDRNFSLGSRDFRQTLEPVIYYAWVPFRRQDELPLFDTSVNTLTYDQLFVWNRFNGPDRIGDTHQISYGLTTRLLSQYTGVEQFRAGIGQILYLQDRQVVLPPATADATHDKSPLTGLLVWQINPFWHVDAASIWNVRTNSFENQTISVDFRASSHQLFHAGYSFVRKGDILPTDPPNSIAANLSQTDLSFAWPMSPRWSMVGRWTQNWNHHHFQNLLYGLEYNACCWAVRLVAARAFTGLNANNAYQYDTGIAVQIALKGLGSFGSSDPAQLLGNSIPGYQSDFGQMT